MSELCLDELTPYKERPTNEELASLIIPILFSIISFLLEILYIVVLKVILSCKEWREKSFYQFIICIGILDCIQLTVHILTGIMQMVFHFNSMIKGRSYYFVKIIGAIVISSWYPMLLATLFLAFDRFIAFVYVWLRSKLFSKTMIRVYFSILVAVFGTCCIFMLTPSAAYIYDPVHLGWGCQECKPLCGGFGRFDQLFTTISALLTFILYLLITRRALKLRKISANNTWSSHEAQLTIQMFVTISIEIFVVAFWEFEMDIVGQENVFANGASTALWILWNGMNPIIYLIFNKMLRKKFAIYVNAIRSILSGRKDKVCTISLKLNGNYRSSDLSFSKKVCATQPNSVNHRY